MQGRRQYLSGMSRHVTARSIKTTPNTHPNNLQAGPLIATGIRRAHTWAPPRPPQTDTATHLQHAVAGGLAPCASQQQQELPDLVVGKLQVSVHRPHVLPAALRHLHHALPPVKVRAVVRRVGLWGAGVTGGRHAPAGSELCSPGSWHTRCQQGPIACLHTVAVLQQAAAEANKKRTATPAACCSYSSASKPTRRRVAASLSGVR